MYENILNNDSNFCIGPQSGTFCTVDYTIDPPIMHVKNSSGSIIRSYEFSPSLVMCLYPYDVGDYEFVGIKYVGPINQDSYYDGAVFYTLEIGSDESTGLNYNEALNYNKNVIRRWILDASNFILTLDTSYYKISDQTCFFGGRAFSVQYISDLLQVDVSIGTNVITLTSTDNIAKYDKIVIGPSNDITNLGAVEEAYIHSVNGNSVTLRTYSGYSPTKYEYLVGDPITIFKNIYLFSDPVPELDKDGAVVGYLEPYGCLHTISEYSYGQVIHSEKSALFYDVVAADWNSYFECLSFVKTNNLIHLNVLDYTPIKSQILKNTSYDKVTVLPIYDIGIIGSDIYRLQKSSSNICAGNDTLERWSTYNYVVDSLAPYTSTVNSVLAFAVISAQGSTDLTVTVRDQFGVSLSNKSVYINVLDQSGTVLYPFEDIVTDINGNCTIQCTSNGIFEGSSLIEVKVTGGSVANGSAFVYNYIEVHINKLFSNSAVIYNIDAFYAPTATISTKSIDFDQCVHIPCHVRLTSPGGEWVWNSSFDEVGEPTINPTIEDRNKKPNVGPTGLISKVYQPVFNQIETDVDGYPINLSKYIHLPFADVCQMNSFNNDYGTTVYTYLAIEDCVPISQNFISRHLSQGNIVTSDLNQFVFIQEAIPVFWSEKNLPFIDYWIRLRPFAYNLNLDTLSIELYEISYLGESEIINITDCGNKVLFDAGSNLLGIDFSYTFSTLFHNNATVYVKVQVYDEAPTPNLLVVDYWFKIIPDYKAPYIDIIYPSIEALNVEVDTTIVFDIIDAGEGVDIDTLSVYINDRQVQINSTEYSVGNYHIVCIPAENFHYGQMASVFVQVSDRSDNENTLRIGWKFWCADSAGPWFDVDNVTPGRCQLGVKRVNPDIGVQVYAVGGTGLDYDSIRLSIGNKSSDTVITPIVYRVE